VDSWVYAAFILGLAVGFIGGWSCGIGYLIYKKMNAASEHEGE
jgi:hypothetical protein